MSLICSLQPLVQSTTNTWGRSDSVDSFPYRIFFRFQLISVHDKFPFKVILHWNATVATWFSVSAEHYNIRTYIISYIFFSNSKSDMELLVSSHCEILARHEEIQLEVYAILAVQPKWHIAAGFWCSFWLAAFDIGGNRCFQCNW